MLLVVRRRGADATRLDFEGSGGHSLSAHETPTTRQAKVTLVILRRAEINFTVATNLNDLEIKETCSFPVRPDKLPSLLTLTENYFYSLLLLRYSYLEVKKNWYVWSHLKSSINSRS
jgi:hypothetical protein